MYRNKKKEKRKQILFPSSLTVTKDRHTSIDYYWWRHWRVHYWVHMIREQLGLLTESRGLLLKIVFWYCYVMLVKDWLVGPQCRTNYWMDDLKSNDKQYNLIRNTKWHTILIKLLFWISEHKVYFHLKKIESKQSFYFLLLVNQNICSIIFLIINLTVRHAVKIHHDSFFRKKIYFVLSSYRLSVLVDLIDMYQY